MKGVRHKLQEAVDLLYSRGNATSEAYTPLLLQCVRANDVVQAKRLQAHMELHHYEPSNTFLHNRLLHLYAKSGQLTDAKQLFDKMPQRDVFSWNAMLSLYSKLGLVNDLVGVFGLMPHRDSVSYNTVLAGFAGNGCWERALDLFVEMQGDTLEPTEYTYVSVLQACSKLLDLRCGMQVHGRVVVKSLGWNAFICNALTDLYAKCDAVHHARWIFDRMSNRNIVSWNSMISCYLKCGQAEKCIELFHLLLASGIKPDQVTVSSVIGAYFDCGYMDDALKAFSMVREKDIVCWTAMIVGCAQHGKEEDALLFFSQMLREDIKADSFTISSVVNACSRLASLCYGQVIHGKSVHMGVAGDLLVSSALVDMYSKCGEIKAARTIFEMMPERNVVTWNSMITGLAQNGFDIDALDLYEKMLRENFKPDNITFIGVLSACGHAGFVDYGQSCFHSMKEHHGITPTLDHYACMVNLLGRAGFMDRAMNLIKSMPYEPNSLIWSTLLSVSTINKDMENGETAARQLFELDPHNGGPYIMLSNMFAANGRWDKAASIRSLMKSNEAKKFAAYSWVEIDGQVSKFVAEDRSHPDAEKIYDELSKIIKKLQEAGFRSNANLVLHNVGEDEKLETICYHSEKLALAYSLVKKPTARAPIRIMKNIRVCGDCHVFMKFVSKHIRRSIILRDSNRFHHFSEGRCSCNDYW